MKTLCPFLGLALILLAVPAWGQENLDSPSGVYPRVGKAGLFRYFDDPYLEAADRLDVLASQAYRTGSYLKSGLLFIEAAETYQKIKALSPSSLGMSALSQISQELSLALMMAGHPEVATAFLRTLPESVSSVKLLESSMGILQKNLGVDFLPDDNPCNAPNRPFDWELWHLGQQYSPLRITSDAYAQASRSTSAGEFFESAVMFLNAAQDFSVADNGTSWESWNARTSSYYCSVNSFLLSGRKAEGIERLCKQIVREPSEYAMDVLVNGIQLLSARWDLDVREICGKVFADGKSPRIPVEIDRRWRNCEGSLGGSERVFDEDSLDSYGDDPLQAIVGRPGFASECAGTAAILDLQTKGEYEAMGGLALAMGTTILVGPDDGRWMEEPGVRRDCIPGGCKSLRELSASWWLDAAATAYLMSGGAFHAKAEMERINSFVPALFELLGSDFFYLLNATYFDPYRSILMQGMDVEMLSTSRYEPVLFDSKQNHRLKPFLGESDTSKSEDFFRKADEKYRKRKYARAAHDFFHAALSLDMECATDLCRDSLWLWRSHAVWNAVTSLRQLNDPVDACEEAKKFVILAGEGHQKSAAADVEHALCGDTPEKPGQE